MKRAALIAALIIAVLACGCAPMRERPVTLTAEVSEKIADLATKTFDALCQAHVDGKVTKDELAKAKETYDKVVVVATKESKAYAVAATAIELGELDPESPEYQAKLLQLQSELSALVSDLLDMLAKVEARK